MIRNQRGVVLVYVMVLMALLGYVAAMLLNASLSRRVTAQGAMDSNETRADMATVNGLITSALTEYNRLNPGSPWPTSTCANPPSLAPWLGASSSWMLDDDPSDNIPPRLYNYKICTGPPANPARPPCRIVINICRRGPYDAPSATCPQPPGC